MLQTKLLCPDLYELYDGRVRQFLLLGGEQALLLAPALPRAM